MLSFPWLRNLKGTLAPRRTGHSLMARNRTRAHRPQFERLEERNLLSGVLDTAFDSDGRVTTDFLGPVGATAYAVLQLPDGRILAAGATEGPNAPTANFALARYAADGTPDLTFGTDGQTTTDFDGFDVANGMARDSQGRIVLVGSSTADPINGSHQFVVARYLPNGTLDTTFGTGGKVTTRFSSIYQDDQAFDVVIQPDDKIVVVGQTFTGPVLGYDWAVARYQTDGSLDPSFAGGAGQFAFSPVGVLGAPDVARTVALQPDGASFRIIVGGGAFEGGSDFALARLNLDGSVDSGQPGDSTPGDHFGFLGNGTLRHHFTTGSALDADGVPTVYFSAEQIYDIAIQPDGRIVAAGTTEMAYQVDDSAANFALVRYPADGNGLPTPVITDLGFAQGHDVARSVAITAGNIYVAGWTGLGSGEDFAVACYKLSDLSLETAFYGDGEHPGQVRTDWAGNTDRAYAILLRPDDKIVAVGRTQESGSDYYGSYSNRFALARYQPQGRLDPTFYSNQPVPAAARSVTLSLPNGKLLVASTTLGSGAHSSDFALARYLPDGTLDATFGMAGYVTTDFGGQDEPAAIALDSLGRIVVAGSRYHEMPGDYAFAVARYLPDGSFDPAFGSNGRVLTHVNPNAFGYDSSQAFDMVIQPDDKIVVVGQTLGTPIPFYEIGAVRYQTDGSLDPSFGNMGRAVFSNVGAGKAVALQPDGASFKIILISTGPPQISIGPPPPPNRNFYVMRVLLDGTPDPSFTENNTDFQEMSLWADDVASDVTILSDGRIVVVGTSPSGAGNREDFIVAIYPKDGRLPNGAPFPEAARRVEFGTPWYTTVDTAYSVAIHGSKVIVAGSSERQFAVARLNLADLSLDTTFNPNGFRPGTVTTEIGAFTANEGRGMTVQPDGKIVVVGSTTANAPRTQYSFADVALVRYKVDGSIDATFGTSGSVVTRLLERGLESSPLLESALDTAADVLIQPNGKIVAVGSTKGFFNGISTPDIALARYNSDGSLDSTFGKGGRVAFDFGYAEEATAAALQPDGKIVVVGVSQPSPYEIVGIIARYLPDGTPDTTFGPAHTGLLRDFDQFSGFIKPTAVAVQDLGAGTFKILVTAAGTGDFQVVRYNADGTLDNNPATGFGATHSGVVSVGFEIPPFLPYTPDTAVDLVLQPDGKIVVVGNTAQTFSDIGLIRLNADGTLDDGSSADSTPADRFGFDGRVTSDFPLLVTEQAVAVGLQANGKIVVVGTVDHVYVSTGPGSPPPPDRDFLVERFNPDGSRDDGTAADSTPGDSFGTLGYVVTDVSGLGIDDDVPTDMVITPTGKIIVAGETRPAPDYDVDFTVVAYERDGALDTSFGSGGLVTTTFLAPSGARANDRAVAIAFQANGDYVVAGTTDNLGQVTLDDFALARYGGDHAPIAMTSAPFTVAEGGSVGLSGAGSSDPDQPAATLTYLWDLDGDGTYGETGADALRGDETGITPTFVPAGLDGPGMVTVSLRVIDNTGLSDTVPATITITNVAPTIALTGAASVQVGDSYSLTLGAVIDPGIDTVVQYIVDWDDGTTVPFPSAGIKSHTYTSGPATRTIKVHLVDEDGTHLNAGTLTLTVTTGDTDADGVSDVTENGAPNGDGNGDGIPDSQQGHVASLRSLLNPYVTLALDANTLQQSPGAHFVSVQATSLPPVALPPPPTGVTFPAGFLSFRIEGLTPGATATVELWVHGSSTIGSYWKLGPEPGDPTQHWYELARDNGLDNHLTLTFVDNGKGDDDLNGADGKIIDPGAPALFTPAATVQSVAINNGSVQRSMVTRLTVAFSTLVDLDPGAIRVVQLGSGGDDVSLALGVTESAGRTEVVVTFLSGPGGIVGGSLADGNYQLIVDAAKVRDRLFGQALDGDGDGTAGGDRVDAFFRLFGDSDGNRIVDDKDLALFRTTFRKKAGDAAFLWWFDSDGDGDVDAVDSYEMSRRRNKTLAP